MIHGSGSGLLDPVLRRYTLFWKERRMCLFQCQSGTLLWRADTSFRNSVTGSVSIAKCSNILQNNVSVSHFQPSVKIFADKANCLVLKGLHLYRLQLCLKIETRVEATEWRIHSLSNSNDKTCRGQSHKTSGANLLISLVSNCCRLHFWIYIKFWQ